MLPDGYNLGLVLILAFVGAIHTAIDFVWLVVWLFNHLHWA